MAIFDGLGLTEDRSPCLGELESTGLVFAKRPGDNPESGQWAVYSVNDPAVSELVMRLTQELGET